MSLLIIEDDCKLAEFEVRRRARISHPSLPGDADHHTLSRAGRRLRLMQSER